MSSTRRSRRPGPSRSSPPVSGDDDAGGAILGIAAAYLALAATYLDDLAYLGRIPVLPLALIIAGLPLAATAAGWLLAGREPAAIARPAIE